MKEERGTSSRIGGRRRRDLKKWGRKRNLKQGVEEVKEENMDEVEVKKEEDVEEEI